MLFEMVVNIHDEPAHIIHIDSTHANRLSTPDTSITLYQIIKNMIIMLEFFQSAIKLKEISRQGWIQKSSIKYPESVADHTYAMSVMGMVLSDVRGYDTVKVIKMSLLHDLAESEIGDLVPDQIPLEEKQELESKAFDNITSDLPFELKQDYQRLWTEYCTCRSPEAKLVHQLDKLEMVLQAKEYQKAGYSVDVLVDSVREYIKDPKLKELFETILET